MYRFTIFSIICCFSFCSYGSIKKSVISNKNLVVYFNLAPSISSNGRIIRSLDKDFKIWPKLSNQFHNLKEYQLPKARLVNGKIKF